MTADADALDDLANGFADKLTTLTRGVLPGDFPRFHAVNMGRRIRVAPMDNDEVIVPVPVMIDRVHRLDLRVVYDCCWDGHSTFMATDRADFHIHYKDGSEPMVRFEYVRDWKYPMPGAHIHVHAHRDEAAYLLRLAHSGRPQAALRRGRLPRLAEMHFPVGGHRMRPSLEDVLLFLKREFEIDVVSGWHAVIDEHLRDWRVMQVKTLARDAPEAAAEALRLLGYQVSAPPEGNPPLLDDSKLFQP